MKLTNTTNSTLARATSLDASFISRLRSGAREPSKKQNYISSIALFFARNIYDGYQKTALCDVMQLEYSDFPEIKSDLKLLLEEWLLTSSTSKGVCGSRFLSNLSDLSFGITASVQKSDQPSANQAHVIESTVAFGQKGKRELIDTLSSMILENSAPDTLYLICEEQMNWTYDDMCLVKQFYSKILRITASGNKIKIIHSLKRDLSDLYFMINAWLPLYVTGAIEPYYYPKIRDGLIKSTLVVAPKSGAIVSFSIGNEQKDNANFLIKDKKTVAALFDEFNGYLALCKPLIQISYPKIKNEHLELLLRFEQTNSDCIFKANMFSSLTMPEATFSSVIQHANPALTEHLLCGYKKRIEAFTENLKSHRFTELIYLPSVEALKKSRVKANIFHAIGYGEFYYNKEDFLSHVRGVIYYLNTYPNYNVNLISKDFLFDCQVYVKNDVGVILSKSDSPMMIVSITEPTLTDVIWNYLSNDLINHIYSKSDKQNTIKRLDRLIEELS